MGKLKACVLLPPDLRNRAEGHAHELVRARRTITQRFTMPTAVEGETCEVDVDADCR